MKLLNAYVAGLENSFNMKGRASRSDYWLFTLMSIIVGVGLLMISKELYYVYGFLTIPTWFTLMVRRFKDANRSPWLMLVGLIPLLGGLWMLYFLCQPSVEPVYEIDAEVLLTT